MPFTLPFGDWRPDQPALADVMSVADNVLPGPNGYAPLPGFVALPGSALPGYPLGGGSFVDSARFVRTFVGNFGGLFEYSSAGWNQVGSNYAASDTNLWSFKQYGQWVVASNGADVPQYFDLSSGSAFAPLPGSPPRMKMLAVVGDFLVGGVINDNAAMVRWSGINKADEWRVGVGQSDFNVFPDGGDVTALSSGEFGLIFQSESIRRMTYVGGDLIFQFNVISPNIGCVHPRGFAQVGRLCFFLSPRGFMVCDGNTVTPIGDQSVDATFGALSDPSYLGRMSCVADPVRKIVYWSVPAADPSVWFAYNWTLQRWSRVMLPARLLFAGRARDITLEDTVGLDDDFYDAGLSFDDPSYMGGAPAFYLFNNTNVLGSLTGPPAAAALATPLLEAAPGQSLRTSRVRPVGDAVAGLTLALDARARVGDAASVSSHGELTVEGDMPALRRGRYMSARVNIAAGTPWTFMRGVSVEGRAERGLR